MQVNIAELSARILRIMCNTWSMLYELKGYLFKLGL